MDQKSKLFHIPSMRIDYRLKPDEKDANDRLMMTLSRQYQRIEIVLVKN